EPLRRHRHRLISRFPQRPAERLARLARHGRCTPQDRRRRAHPDDQGDERRSGGVRPVAMPKSIQGAAQGVAQWGVLVVLSAALAALLLWVHAPAARMLGTLAAAIAVSSDGARLGLALMPFVLALGFVGCLIAKMVPLSIA